MNAAQKQKWLSMEDLTSMQCRIVECHMENGNPEASLGEYTQTLGVLDLIGTGEAWDSEREYIRKQISSVRARMA